MQHKQLSEGRWFDLSFFEQMANVGSEVERAINCKKKNDKEYFQLAIDRALELLTFTIDDKKNSHRLKEVVRVYEALNDYFYGNNKYQSTNSLWQRYFYNFAYAVRNKII